FIAAAELEAFFSETVRTHFPAARIQPDPVDSEKRVLRPDSQLHQHMLSFVRSRAERQRAGRLPALLEQNGPILLTFDMGLATRARELEFLTPRHPLIRAFLDVYR